MVATSLYIGVSATAITLSALNPYVNIQKKEKEITLSKPFEATDKVARKTVEEFEAYSKCRDRSLPAKCRKYGKGKYTW